MQDSVYGVFADRASAEHAHDRLVADGWDDGSVSVRTVIPVEQRGLGVEGAAYSLLHAPTSGDDASEDAGVDLVVITVEDDAGEATEALQALGADLVEHVPGTPPLDL